MQKRFLGTVSSYRERMNLVARLKCPSIIPPILMIPLELVESTFCGYHLNNPISYVYLSFQRSKIVRRFMAGFVYEAISVGKY